MKKVLMLVMVFILFASLTVYAQYNQYELDKQIREMQSNAETAAGVGFLAVFITAILIGLIPAFIARKKGYSFILWWLYGAGIFIIALPHSLLMRPKGSKGPLINIKDIIGQPSEPDVIEQIKKLDELKKLSLITQQEFDEKKKSLLSRI